MTDFITKSPMTQDQMISRIAEIDHAFNSSEHWGSWMVSAANERVELVNNLRACGHIIEHKHQARTATGGRVD